MGELVERLRYEAKLIRAERDGFKELTPRSATMDEAADRIEALEKALEPFAKVGKLIDGPFGPALFADDEDAFQSGCAWTEDGERKTLTWGQFRRACTLAPTPEIMGGGNG